MGIYGRPRTGLVSYTFYTSVEGEVFCEGTEGLTRNLFRILQTVLTVPTGPGHPRPTCGLEVHGRNSVPTKEVTIRFPLLVSVLDLRLVTGSSIKGYQVGTTL